MKNQKWFHRMLGLALVAGLALSCQQKPATEDAAKAEVEPKQELEAFVQKAAAAVHEKGEAAFADFRQADSEWFHGDRYVFVSDMHGLSLCQPTNPEMEGTNLSDTEDANGKAIVQEMLAALENSTSTWVSYKWPKPGETDPSNKSSFVVKTQMGDKMVAVGSGMYTE